MENDIFNLSQLILYKKFLNFKFAGFKDKLPKPEVSPTLTAAIIISGTVKL